MTILSVYARISGKYAIYRTDERLVIQWADAATLDDDGKPLGAHQREALAPLAGLRGEINGLIDGWRKSHGWLIWRRWNAGRAERYDRLVADAMAMGLAGDPASAHDRLIRVRDAILAERTALGRVQYVFAALLTGLMAVLLSYEVAAHYAAAQCQLPGKPVVPCEYWFYPVVERWTAAGFGTVGAFLSVALQIRSRDVRLDLQTSSNVTDAALRICVGALSAVTIVTFLQARILTLQVNSASINGGSGEAIGFAVLIVASIAAGFTERLVSTVIAGVTVKGVAPVAADAPVSSGRSRGKEDDPGGRTPPAPTPAPPSPNAAAAAPPPDDAVDACPEDKPASSDEATDDVELPEATGGVAQQG